MRYIIYISVLVLLFLCEELYFRLARHFHIVDRPNARSSHQRPVLRGGGIIFPLSCLMWLGVMAAEGHWARMALYAPFLTGFFLVATVSFVDDIHSLRGSLRLAVQFLAMALMFHTLGVWTWEVWWVSIVGLVVCVGATNIINFMDGFNGNLVGLAVAVLAPVFYLNRTLATPFVEESLLIVVAMSVAVFGWFNVHPNGHARCFSGDVGSVSIAFLSLFAIGQLVAATCDVTYLVFLLVYGVEGCLTIGHRLLLRENITQAHRKHAFQLMVNELGIGHVKVALLYMGLQLAVTAGFLLLPATPAAHWTYLAVAAALLSLAYILFMRRYYPLHEAYLASIKGAE